MIHPEEKRQKISKDTPQSKIHNIYRTSHHNSGTIWTIFGNHPRWGSTSSQPQCFYFREQRSKLYIEDRRWYKDTSLTMGQKLYRVLGTYVENEATFFLSIMEWRVTSSSTVNPDEGEFIVDSGVTILMMSKDIPEEITVYGKDLDMFVTVQLLRDTPAVYCLGKFFEENGYSYEWKEGHTPNIMKHGKITPCK